jgi:hypothetical protein
MSEDETGLVLPFPSLPSISAEARAAIEAAAIEANERYLVDIVEGHAFCPFSRGGRAQGQTARFVHYCSEKDPAAIVERMVEAAQNPDLVVLQVILPGIQIAPEAWIALCNQLTALGNRRLSKVSDVFAVAALHPELPFQTTNPFTLIPLFRRSPDPTIQWVRLDGLKALYEGRTSDTTIVDPSEIDGLELGKERTPLFDQIAESNQEMARRLGIDEVEQALAEISRSAQDRYAEILQDY